MDDPRFTAGLAIEGDVRLNIKEKTPLYTDIIHERSKTQQSPDHDIITSLNTPTHP